MWKCDQGSSETAVVNTATNTGGRAFCNKVRAHVGAPRGGRSGQGAYEDAQRTDTLR
jgi:hypothetical protein